tara:strand:- start:124 stop:621 length:498 start_codon:yes stop_codon:yes gene_type:complete
MAYGKIKSDALVYDNSGSDVEIVISSIPTATQLAAKADTSALNAKAGLDAAQTFTKGQRGEVTTLTGTTPAPDLDDSNNFTLTTSGNTTFGLPTNVAVGQTGSIFVVYGGAHTLAFNAAYKFVGGAAGITPTSTSGAIDRIDYIVQNAASGYVCLTCNFTANYVA